jgi:uncharacterized protein (DUF58 family)
VVSSVASVRADLLTPAELTELGGLEWIARAVVDGFLTGLHPSSVRGVSAEFAEHRGYRPGDDLRFFDWRIYGRSDRLFVKQFQEERNLAAYLCLDVSRSMDWRSRDAGLVTKLEYGRRVCAAFALLLARQGDAVGLVCVDDAVRRWLPARAAPNRWREVVRALVETEPGVRTAPESALHELANRVPGRGCVVLVSDLLAEPAAVVEGLVRLRHAGHHVLVFHLLDPGERELPPVGDAIFVDPETGADVPARSSELRDAYRRAVVEAIDGWRTTLGAHGIEYELLETDRALAPALRAFLARRARWR